MTAEKTPTSSRDREIRSLADSRAVLPFSRMALEEALQEASLEASLGASLGASLEVLEVVRKEKGREIRRVIVISRFILDKCIICVFV